MTGPDRPALTVKLAATAAVGLGNAAGVAILASPAWILLAWGWAAWPVAVGVGAWLWPPALLVGRWRS